MCHKPASPSDAPSCRSNQNFLKQKDAAQRKFRFLDTKVTDITRRLREKQPYSHRKSTTADALAARAVWLQKQKENARVKFATQKEAADVYFAAQHARKVVIGQVIQEADGDIKEFCQAAEEVGALLTNPLDRLLDPQKSPLSGANQPDSQGDADPLLATLWSATCDQKSLPGSPDWTLAMNPSKQPDGEVVDRTCLE